MYVYIYNILLDSSRVYILLRTYGPNEASSTLSDSVLN